MACCALKKQKRQWLIFSLLLFILTSITAGITLLCLEIGALILPRWKIKKKKAASFFLQLLRGLTEKMLGAPFLFSSNFRCQLSGRLMSLSPAVAGMVYRYFNLIVLSFISAMAIIWLHIFRII